MSPPLVGVAGADRPYPPCSRGSWRCGPGMSAVGISSRPERRASCPRCTGTCHGVDRTLDRCRSQLARCRSHPRPVSIAARPVSITARPVSIVPSCGVDRTLSRCRSHPLAMSIAPWLGTDCTMARHGLHDGSATIASQCGLDRIGARCRSHYEPAWTPHRPVLSLAQRSVARNPAGVDRTGIRWGRRQERSASDLGTHRRLHQQLSIEGGSDVHCGRMSWLGTVTPSLPLRVRSVGTEGGNSRGIETPPG
jgi:hypothetical protein